MFARSPKNATWPFVTAVTLFAGGVRRHIRALGVNPLVRMSDRLEALAVLGVLLVALVALPLADRADTLVNDSGVHTALQQTQTRHSVQALVVAGSGLPTDFGTPDVSVQWQEGTHTRTESVVSTATVQTGDRMTIWLDESGKVVAAPLTEGDAGLNAALAAATVWITIVACAAAAALLVRRALDRSRDRDWDRALNLLAHNDDGWANRHA
jgi:hypothetical protein